MKLSKQLGELAKERINSGDYRGGEDFSRACVLAVQKEGNLRLVLQRAYYQSTDERVRADIKQALEELDSET